MDSRHDEISWVHDGWHMLLDHPEYLGIALGMIGVGVWWWLRQVFVTKSGLDACRKDVAEDGAVAAVANAKDHKEIRKDIAEKHAETRKAIAENHADVLVIKAILERR
jgi:hypothetical protein